MNRETSTNFEGKPEMVKKGNSQKKKKETVVRQVL